MRLRPTVRWSCEANPGTVSRDELALMRRAGVGRLSLGVQAAQDELLLRTIGRIHTFDAASMAFKDARAAGFDDINLDFIYALPGQTPGMVARDAGACAGTASGAPVAVQA